MCISSNLDYAKFGLSNLCFAEVIHLTPSPPTHTHTHTHTHLIKERLTYFYPQPFLYEGG